MTLLRQTGHGFCARVVHQSMRRGCSARHGCRPVLLIGLSSQRMFERRGLNALMFQHQVFLSSLNTCQPSVLNHSKPVWPAPYLTHSSKPPHLLLDQPPKGKGPHLTARLICHSCAPVLDTPQRICATRLTCEPIRRYCKA